ncbi:hypothetical protein D3C73_743380 [compost metagenome]
MLLQIGQQLLVDTRGAVSAAPAHAAKAASAVRTCRRCHAVRAVGNWRKRPVQRSNQQDQQPKYSGCIDEPLLLPLQYPEHQQQHSYCAPSSQDTYGPATANGTVIRMNDVPLEECCSECGHRKQPGQPGCTLLIIGPEPEPACAYQCRNRRSHHNQVVLVEEPGDAEESHNRYQPGQPEQRFFMFLGKIPSAQAGKNPDAAEQQEGQQPAGLTGQRRLEQAQRTGCAGIEHSASAHAASALAEVELAISALAVFTVRSAAWRLALHPAVIRSLAAAIRAPASLFASSASRQLPLGLAVCSVHHSRAALPVLTTRSVRRRHFPAIPEWHFASARHSAASAAREAASTAASRAAVTR